MDFALFTLINGLAHKYFLLDKIMIFITHYFQYIILFTLVILWFKKDSRDIVIRNRRAVIFAVITTLVALGINHIIGFLYFRPRPYTIHAANLLINPSVDPSFPSDHATFAFTLAFCILKDNKAFGNLLLVFAVLLGFSRVYVGIHYPFDVIGGALIGFVTFIILKRYSKYIYRLTDFILEIWDKIFHKK